MNTLKSTLSVTLLQLLLLGFVDSAYAALNVAVDAGPANVAPSQGVLVEVTVTNNGGTPESNVSVSMPYPAGMFSVSESLFDGPFTDNCSSSVCSAGEVMVWNLGTMNPGQAVTFSLPPVVSSVTADGTDINWSATLLQGGLPQITRTATVIVDSTALLSLAIDEDQDPVESGTDLTYTLRYGNRSTASVTNTGLSFPIPANSSFVSATGGGVLTNGEVSWDLATLPAGAVAQQRVVVTVDGGLATGTLIESQAEIAGTSTSNSQPTAQQVTEVAYVAPATDTPLALSLNVIPSPVQPAQGLNVELTVTNVSGAQVQGAVVAMRYPLGGMFSVAESLFDGPFTDNCSSSVCSAGEVMVWNLGTMNPGQAVTFSLPPVVSSVAQSGSVITWEASVREDNGSLRTESITAQVDDDPALTIAIDEDQDPVESGTDLTYTLRYGNRSTASVTNTGLSFPIPANSSFVSATGGGVLTNGEVSWDLATLPAGAVAQQRVVVTVDGGLATGTLIESQAEIAGTSTSNSQPTAQQVTEVAYVAPATDTPLALSLNVIPSPVQPAQGLNVELTVTNVSGAQVQGAVVAMRYPLGGMFSVAESLFDGPFTDNCSSSVCSAGEVMVWNLGTMNPGQAVTFSLPPVVSSVAQSGSVITWEASVREDNGSLRTESITAQVDDDPALTIAIDEDQDPVESGTDLTYTLRYGNRSTASVTNTGLSFPIPANSSFVSATGGGVLANGEVSWDLATLPAGAVAQQQVIVAVDTGLDTGTLLESEAVISGASSFLPTERRTTEVAYVAPDDATPLDLILNITPQPAQASDTLGVALSVTNSSATTVFGATVSMRYPLGGMFSVAESLFDGPFTDNCSSSVCSAGEVMVWNLGTMNPGQTVSFSLPPIVSSVTANGNIINWRAMVREDNASVRNKTFSLLIGDEVDGDGIPDNQDNCITIFNPDQRDSNGDGFGNICDADLNNDGAVNFADLGILRSVFFTADADADLNGDGAVNFADLGIMRLLFFNPPGPSGVAQ